MRIPRIYCPNVLTSGLEIQLDKNASNHILNVLRLQVNAELRLFNNGYEYRAELINIKNRLAIVKIKDNMPSCPESPLQIHLGQSLARGEKMDWIIQKAVELGVTHITPLMTERCGLVLSADRLTKRLDHWQKIMINACEQCGRTVIPQLYGPVNLLTWLQTPAADLNLVLHHRATMAIKTLTHTPQTIKILIGPEGGLSDNEIMQATTAKFLSIRLGPRVLRTETAPIAAISALQYQWGDLH